jgi:hypothetical protein
MLSSRSATTTTNTESRPANTPTTLDGVTSVLDEIEDRADRLLAELLELIEDPR